MIHLLVFISFLLPAWGFQAFSCSDSYKSYIKYDRLAVQDCNMKDNWLVSDEELEIQLVQKKYVEQIEVLTCELEYSIQIGKCGIDGIR